MSNITEQIEKLNFYGWTGKGMKENPDIPLEDVFILRSEVLALQNKVSDINTDTKIEEDLIYRIVENWGNALYPISEMVKWVKEYASIVNNTGGKGYEFFKGELLAKCDRLLRDKGVSSAETNECISLAIEDLKNVFHASIVNERKDSDAIEFADWIGEQSRVCFLCVNNARRWYKMVGNDKSLTTEELYQQFQESHHQKQSRK